MAPPDHPIRTDGTATGPAVDVDVLVVGAGVTGIYQAVPAREAGFSVEVVEAGGGVGGTWFWNRYPGARFDSESYTYAYLFSQELFDEWTWEEHFAEQPETERYLNHVVDRFDLRRHITFGVTVDVGHLRRGRRVWIGGAERRHPSAGPGSSSRPPACCRCPSTPRCRAARTSRASRSTPGGGRSSRSTSPASGWPSSAPGPSGVQIIPVIADEVASLTVYQRTANWCTPLNNSPITPERAGAAPRRLRDDARDPEHVGRRLPPRAARPCRVRRLRGGAAGVLRARCGAAPASPSCRATTPTCSSTRRPTRRGATSSPTRSAASSHDPGDGRQAHPDATTASARSGRRSSPGTTRRSTSPKRLAGRPEGHADPARSPRPGSRRPTAWSSSTSSSGRPASTSAPARSTAWASAAAAVVALDGPLGRGPDHVPRRADHRLPQLLLPRRAARRRRQQPPVQRRPGRLRHRHARVRARPRLRHHRGRSRGRGALDRDGRPGRGDGAVRRARATSSAATSRASRRKYLLNSGGRPKLFKEIARVERHRTTRRSACRPRRTARRRRAPLRPSPPRASRGEPGAGRRDDHVRGTGGRGVRRASARCTLGGLPRTRSPTASPATRRSCSTTRSAAVPPCGGPTPTSATHVRTIAKALIAAGVERGDSGRHRHGQPARGAGVDLRGGHGRRRRRPGYPPSRRRPSWPACSAWPRCPSC